MWAIFPEVGKFLTLHYCSQLRHHFSSHFGAYFIFLSFSDFDFSDETRTETIIFGTFLFGVF
jgi:hypothetical protein